MKIAIIGVRSIPLVYSAFETFAEILGEGLTERGFDITVYCRSPYSLKSLKEYKGIYLVTIPTLKGRYYETVIHTFLSTLHACFFGRHEVIYYLGVGNAVFTFIPRLFGIKTIINVDGLEWQRKRWNFLVRRYLKLSELLATKFADTVVTDSLFIKNYYKREYKADTEYIPYTFIPPKINQKEEVDILEKYHLQK